MSRVLHLFTIGFGRTDLLRHQDRLLQKHLRDPYELTLIDNTPDAGAAAMERMADALGIDYRRPLSEERLHNDALNYAAAVATVKGCDYWLVMDHDVFPTEDVQLTPRLDEIGFLGVGQRHPATKHRYLWPGFCGFKREWLDGQVPDFDGIRGAAKRDDGDCGSMLWQLFSTDDWANFDRLPQRHGYENIRAPDDYGLQSFGVEWVCDSFLHFTNGSNWMVVPDADERTRLLLAKLEAL